MIFLNLLLSADIQIAQAHLMVNPKDKLKPVFPDTDILCIYISLFRVKGSAGETMELLLLPVQLEKSCEESKCLKVKRECSCSSHLWSKLKALPVIQCQTPWEVFHPVRMNLSAWYSVFLMTKQHQPA